MYYDISIHAPSRERHIAAGAELERGLISIHAPSRERRPERDALLVELVISIHAPSRERLDKAASGMSEVHFNPRSLAGATWESDDVC